MAFGIEKAGVETVKEAKNLLDDAQADLDKRQAALIALLQGKRIVITIEVEDKEKPK